MSLRQAYERLSRVNHISHWRELNEASEEMVKLLQQSIGYRTHKLRERMR